MSAEPVRFTASLLLGLLAAAITVAGFPVVETTSGTVRGYYPEPDLRAFLGIPYAQPPIGSRRFRPPEPMKQKQDRMIDATLFGFSCYQYRVDIVGATALGPTTGESEDCLTLNVWASDKNSAYPRPVLVWMHGGAFTEGSSSVPMYDGRYLAAAHPDIIMVTINYRVSVFGFANSPAVPEKNAGLRDQRLAVEWLRDNIAAFGGDPDRMVLGGQSAGGMSTGMYAYAYPNDPIVRGLIMESGEASTMVPDDGTQWTSLAKALECQSSDAMEEFTCMQGINAFTLKRTLGPDELTPLSSAPEVRPTVDNVTYFGPAGYAALGATGKFARIPALRGITNNEGNALAEFTPEGPLNHTFADWLTNIAFNCPAAAEADVWAVHGIPSWRYRYFGEFPSVLIYDWLKAYHGSEVPFLLGTVNNVRVRDLEPSEREAQVYLQQAVASFVKDPVNGLEGFGWPVYNSNTTTLVELFKNNLPNATFAEGATYDGSCS